MPLLFVRGIFAYGSNDQGETDWKILIYMQVDNDLEKYAYLDIKEIEQEVGAKVPVIIYLDLPGDEGFKRLSSSSSQEGLVDFGIIAEEETGQVEIIQDLVEWGNRVFPTKHTMLVIWGHGEGYGGEKDRFGGFALDSKPKRRLSVSSLANGLRDKLFKVDILTMDACLMQNLEVISELEKNSDYFIGSSQIQNFQGLPYDTILKFMNEKKELSPGELAKKIPALFEDRAMMYVDYDERTMSAIDGRKVSTNFYREFSSLMKVVNDKLEGDFYLKTLFQREMNDLPAFYGDTTDFSTFLSFMSEFFTLHESEVTLNMIKKVMHSFETALVSHYYGEFYFDDELYANGSFNGVSIWLPKFKENYVERRDEFNSGIFFKKNSEWERFFKILYNQL